MRLLRVEGASRLMGLRLGRLTSMSETKRLALTI
jgi:hypothetical protein